MKKNYLFSTTRQWNPGDEFILFGLLRVLRSIADDFNPVIFNRNPEIKHREGAEFNLKLDFKRLTAKKLKPAFYDNSFKQELSDIPFIDLVVFAGTPEWASARMKVLYDYIERFNLPIVYLGIGVGSEDFRLENLPQKYREVLKRALLVTVRDPIAEKVLSSHRAFYLPCPAFLSAPPEWERAIERVTKIGLIYMAPTGVRSNKIDKANHVFLVELYKRLMEAYRGRFQFEFVCHYVDELAHFQKDFPGHTCHYSYDAAEYARIYRDFDFVMGHRVHGIGMAASLGIPGINIQHDARGGTCYGFMADILDASRGVREACRVFASAIDSPDAICQKSRKLLLRKNEVFAEYVRLLKPILAQVNNPRKG